MLNIVSLSRWSGHQLVIRLAYLYSPIDINIHLICPIPRLPTSHKLPIRLVEVVWLLRGAT